MPAPLIMIDTSQVYEGKLDHVRALMEQMVLFVKGAEPRTIAYEAYLEEDAAQLTVLQIYPDSSSARFGLQTSGAAIPALAELTRVSAIDVYGEPGESVLAQIRRKADLLGGGAGAVRVHPPAAGFRRFAGASAFRAQSSRAASTLMQVR